MARSDSTQEPGENEPAVEQTRRARLLVAVLIMLGLSCVFFFAGAAQPRDSIFRLVFVAIGGNVLGSALTELIYIVTGLRTETAILLTGRFGAGGGSSNRPHTDG
jgi:hypothetical protein